MRKVVRLTESDLSRIVRRVINEQTFQDAASVLQACSSVQGSPIADIQDIAGRINQAIDGIGTDEEGVYDALEELNDSVDLCLLNNAYYKMYRESLFDALDGDFDGSEADHCWKTIVGKSKIQRHGRR